jgi:UDP-N-acetylglucosamine 2-epimerase (non-hydrolysing)
MPEEINRVVTDTLADLLFTPSEDGDLNLCREGIAKEKIHRVGNVMIDSLVRLLPATTQMPCNEYPDRFALVTLHRPSNVDDCSVFNGILESLLQLREYLEVVFPVHPRTRKRILDLGFNSESLYLTKPLSYLEFLALQRRAALVITDSGGIQEETTYLGIPCLTLRDNTERPTTVNLGTNVLIGRDRQKLVVEVEKILRGRAKQGRIPPLWDGVASERIARIISEL